MIWWMLALAAFLLWLILRPVSIQPIESHPQPVTSYEEAVTCTRSMQDEDYKALARDVCVTKFLDHGRQTEHAIVLLHGFTNCPEQFHELGKQFFEAGYNVLIPRLPYHGLADRLTNALIHLTAENLAAWGERVLDLAHGLGKQVTMLGISGSGTLICWLAQNRADLDYAFSITPLFGLAMIPAAFTKLFERIALLLPNFYMWWDPRTKAENPYSIYYAYPGYPSRALVEIMRLAIMTRLQAEKTAPAAKNIVMVINQSEPAVSNAEIRKLVKRWKQAGKSGISEYFFEKEMKLPHDIITPGTPNLPVELIHPRLVGAVRDVHGFPGNVK